MYTCFLAIFVESLIDGAVVKGLPRNGSYKNCYRKSLSLEYLKKLSILPTDLKGKFAHEGGTTIAGVAAMKKIILDTQQCKV